jgi:succinoglycan biosynthesis transport protein ExoP
MNNHIAAYNRDQNLVTRAPEPEILDLRSVDRLDLRTIYYALQRQRNIILASTVIFVMLAILFTASQTRMYNASTRVVLNKDTENFAPKKDAQGAAPPPTSDLVDTEVEVIRSRNLATSVAMTLNLDRNPSFNPSIKPHESVVHKVLRTVGFVGQPPLPHIQTAEAESAVVNALLASLTVQRVGSTYTFDIGITTPSAEDSQRIADEYATQYTSLYLQHMRASGNSAANFLAKRLEGLRNQAQADTARAQQYRIANNLLSTSGASLTEQEISSYNEQVSNSRAQAEEDIARLKTAQSQLRGGSNGEDVGEALNSPVVGSLRSQRAEVSARLASLQNQFGPLYPSVQKTRMELDDVDGQIAAEIRRVVSNLEAKVKVSSERLGSIEGSLGAARGQLAQNNRAMVGLDDLNRRAEASQQLYDSYLTQYKEVVASQGTERPDSRVLSYADLPTAPVSPRPMLNIILAVVIGASFGIVIGLVREMLYAGLTTSNDIESRLHVRGLGNIPLLHSILPGHKSPLSAMVEHQGSGFYEAFRALRASIKYALDSNHQVLLITSALPREGKTTTSACLAWMAALSGESVVLVDVDVRQRGTSRLIRRDHGRPGLIEVLLGTASLDDALVQDPDSHAWVLPIRRPSGDRSNLLDGEEMDELISALRARFSLVILDASPVLPVADTRILATKVDAIVMVSRWRSTAEHAVRAALRLLPLDTVPIAGIALSQVDIRKQARFGYGDDGLYYKKYKDYYS